MKHFLLAAVAALISTHAWSAETAETLPALNSSIESFECATTDDSKSEKVWKFRLAQSHYSADDIDRIDHKGDGLTIGVERTFGSMFSAGASHTLYKNDATQSGSGGSDKLYSYDLQMTEIYGAASPFRIGYAGVEFVGSILVGGFLSTTNGDGVINFPNSSNGSSSFYGAQLELNFKNQLGIQIGTRVSSQFKSIASLGLVSYY